MRKWDAIRHLVIIMTLLLAGCGSSSGPGAATPVDAISGVAAAGAPVRGKVYLKDSSNPPKELSAPIASDGSFSFATTGLTMPCILKSEGLAGDGYYVLYSLAATPGTANINPLSNLAVKLVSANDPDTLYAAMDPAKITEATSSFPATVARLREALGRTLSVFGASSTNFVTDKFTANHSGLDLMFDLIGIHYVSSGASPGVLFVDKTMEYGAASHQVYEPLNNLLSRMVAITPTRTPPLTEGNICVFPATPLVFANEKLTLSAVVIGNPQQQVSWRVTAGSGSISSDGVYTAPADTGFATVTASTPWRQTSIEIGIISRSPYPFTFADQTLPLREAMYGDSLSNSVRITGVNPFGWPLSITDTGPSPADVLIDNVFYLPGTVPSTIKEGQTLIILQYPSPVAGGTSVTTVKVGGYSTTFTTRTGN